MSFIIPPELSLFEPKYGDEFPDAQYYILLFRKIGSRFRSRNYYNTSLKNYLSDYEGFKLKYKYDYEKMDYKNTELLLINEKKEIIVSFLIVNDGQKISVQNLVILYDINNGDVYNQINFDEIKKYELNTGKQAHINLIKSDNGRLDAEEYDVVIRDINLKLNYGEEFIKIHNKIINRLNNDKDKGIVLLHGEPGTGKTSYIKYLTKLIRNKEIYFIPPAMAELLSDPSIITFLMERKNSILIIEDAEKIISERSINGSSIGVSNLLNLTDGILGDCLNIQVIATFNMAKEKIDDALLRKGRLIVEHKFEKLSIENTNKLLKYLNKNIVSNIGLSLAEIYNIDEEEFKTTKDKLTIGFKK